MATEDGLPPAQVDAATKPVEITDANPQPVPKSEEDRMSENRALINSALQRLTAGRRQNRPAQLEENAERLRRLRFEEVIPKPDIPPEKWLSEALTIYDNRTLPDEAFRYLEEGQLDLVIETLEDNQGAFFHRSQPKAEELLHMPPTYQSSGDELAMELLGQTGTPGVFRMFSLRDECGAMQAWATIRTPPQDPAGLTAYTEHLEKTFFRSDLHLEKGWEHRIRKWFQRVMEFHTMAVEKNLKGGGSFLLAKIMAQLEREMPPDQLPQMVFCFRYDGMQLSERPDDAYVEFGSNDRSNRYTHTSGFRDIGYRYDENDKIARIVPHYHKPVIVQLKRRYSTGVWPTIRSLLDSKLAKIGLASEEIWGESQKPTSAQSVVAERSTEERPQ